MKLEQKKGFVRVYCRAFEIGEEQTELMLTLIAEPKWKSKTETAIRLAIKKLSEFAPEYQKVLIEQAIAGGYQGLVFSDSKQKEQAYLKQNGQVSKISRLERIISSGNNNIQIQAFSDPTERG
jgi:hypothetical protein